MNEKGVSLIELLVATALLVVVMSSLSLFFPQASKAAFNSRYIATAKNLVSGKIQEIKQTPYALIPLTYSAASNSSYTYSFAVSGNGSNGCDCTRENPDTFPIVDPASDNVIDNGVIFVRRTCVNLVVRNTTTTPWTWASHCPDGTSATDQGLKNIRVRVTWTSGAQSKSIDAESMVSR
jgi:prepilin-type N-terminal cleavage/methylation domain-containing protein